MFIRRLLLVLAAALLPFGQAVRAETFNLTIGSSHPTTIPWVTLMTQFFVPEVSKRVEALGKGHRIVWREAYAGQLFKINATLSSVEQGVVDISLVFTTLEPAKLPLAQFAPLAPFTTDDVRVILDVVNEMNETVPALRAEWDKNNTVYLGAWGVDTYHLFTKTPIRSYGDLKGKKISAAGTMGQWLKGSGATAVEGALTTFYTDIQSGVSDGGLAISTGILPAKIYEVAPYITKVDIGALYAGALAMNKDTWNRLPPDVQKVMKDVGKEYSKRLGEFLMQKYQEALLQMVQAGAKQSVPVQVLELPNAEREKWVRTMPNLAADWAKANQAKGLPAKAVLQAYMDGLRKRGVKPLRDWDREL